MDETKVPATSELSGRPAYVFTWTISKRQFQVVMHRPQGDRLMALSSNMSTMLKCMSDMMEIGTGQHTTFEVKAEEGREVERTREEVIAMMQSAYTQAEAMLPVVEADVPKVLAAVKALKEKIAELETAALGIGFTLQKVAPTGSVQ